MTARVFCWIFKTCRSRAKLKCSVGTPHRLKHCSTAFSTRTSGFDGFGVLHRPHPGHQRSHGSVRVLIGALNFFHGQPGVRLRLQRLVEVVRRLVRAGNFLPRIPVSSFRTSRQQGSDRTQFLFGTGGLGSLLALGILELTLKKTF